MWERKEEAGKGKYDQMGPNLIKPKTRNFMIGALSQTGFPIPEHEVHIAPRGTLRRQTCPFGKVTVRSTRGLGCQAHITYYPGRAREL